MLTTQLSVVFNAAHTARSHATFEAQNFMNLMRQQNIQKSFKIAIINVMMMGNILIASYLKKSNPEIFSTIIGILSLVIIILAIIGFSNVMKGIREPNSFKKIIGLVVNSAIVGFGFFLIIANIIDVYRAFG